MFRTTPNCSFHNMASTYTIPQHHIKWRRGATLLLIALNSDPIELRPAEQKPLNLIRVAGLVKMNRPVGREERVEFVMSE
jgi:hypothetical protein